MKILRVFGVVVGIHVFAFLVIFANPGCSSTGKPTPSAGDTVAKSDTSPSITPSTSSGNSPSSSPISSAPMSDTMPTISFTPPSAAGRYSPTRPGTTAATALEAAPVADMTPASTYTVVAGDSLSVIAKRNKIAPAELAAANNLKLTSPIHQGQKLIIPAKAHAATASTPSPAAPAPAAAINSTGEKPAGEVIKHTVKAGETLGTIARRYGVKVGDIGTDNKITDPLKIRPGQELTIRLGKKDASKPASGNTSAARTPAPSSTSASPRSSPPPAPASSAPSGAQDLDAGLRPNSDVPVIKVEEAPAGK